MSCLFCIWLGCLCKYQQNDFIQTDGKASSNAVTGNKCTVSKSTWGPKDYRHMLSQSHRTTQIFNFWKFRKGGPKQSLNLTLDLMTSCYHVASTWKHPVIGKLSEANFQWSIWRCIWGNNICKTIYDYRLTWQFFRLLLSILGFVLPRNWLVRCDLSVIMCG